VEFDDVRWLVDDQVLALPNGDAVTVRVRRGKVTVRVKRAGRRHAA
jgi:formylmethanofuran dehydrogenase subunit D